MNNKRKMKKKSPITPSMLVHTYNHHIWEAEARGL
jgi:hypothetical protein